MAWASDVLRSETTCAGCGADRGALPECGRCGLARFPVLPTDTDDALDGRWLDVARALSFAAGGLLPGAALFLGPTAVVTALVGLGGLAFIPVVAFGLALDDLRRENGSLRRVAAQPSRGAVRAFRGRVRVLAPVAGGAAVVRRRHEIESGRFEVVCDDGTVVLCDDGSVELTATGFRGLGRRIELREGDRVLAVGPTRSAPGGSYRDGPAHLAFDGTLGQPVRLLLEARAR